jgi:peptidoglycan/xylan/chitin deacetylase (PgdA/CDA1 family)
MPLGLSKVIPASLKKRLTDYDLWLYTRAHLLTKPLYSGIGSIMMLHRICPPADHPRLGYNKFLEITPELLEQTILFFKKKKYEFVSLDEVHNILSSGRSQGKFVAFTIDDGYADNYTHAYPVFKSYNVPFAIYVTTSFPDRDAILWWYLLEDLLLRENEVEVLVDGQVIKYDCSTLTGKEAAFDAIQSHLTYASDDNFELKCKSILRAPLGDLNKYVDELALTWDQIRELSREPLATIGAHTIDHRALSKLAPAEAVRQMTGSKLRIESQTGREVRHFAYPYGSREAAGERDFRLVKECGFSTATTTRKGNIFGAHKAHMECLPRIAVTDILSKDIKYLNLWIDGLIPCHENRFQKIVTV